MDQATSAKGPKDSHVRGVYKRPYGSSHSRLTVINPHGKGSANPVSIFDIPYFIHLLVDCLGNVTPDAMACRSIVDYLLNRSWGYRQIFGATGLKNINISSRIRLICFGSLT